MLTDANKAALIILMIVGYILITTHRTSADLFDEDIVVGNRFSMSTLSLSQRNSANSTPVNGLFNISGILPDGFMVGSVKIKKTGKLNFKYRISTEIIGSSNQLCQQLEIELWSRRQTVYNGNLSGLSIDKNIDSDGVDDWVFFANLNNNSQQLQNSTCNFNIVFKTWRDSPNEQKGFWDHEILQNTISSGSWE